MRILAFLVLAVLGGGAVVALAQQQQAPLLPPAAAPTAPESRWSFRRVDDGFVRLDNRTGQVAHCTPRDARWTCQAVPQDRAALEKQVAALQAEIAALKQEIAKLRVAPPPPPPEQEPNVSLRMPTQQEVLQARDYLADTVTDAWHRFVQIIVHFQHDVMRKS